MMAFAHVWAVRFCRLQWSVKRRQRGHETLGQFALSMRLLVGKALRRMGRLEEAELAFQVLAGRCQMVVIGLFS